MKFQPATEFCGLSLFHAVEVICLATLIACITTLSLISSRDPNGTESWKATLSGSWALIGMPITITAAVAALYRQLLALRFYYFYLLASFVFGMCVNPFWTLIFAIPLFCFAYIVWSDCENIAAAPFPSLMQTSEALKCSYSPEVEYDKEGKTVTRNWKVPTSTVPSTKTSWLMSDGWRQGTPQSFIPEPTSMMSDGWRRGTPQSFIPQPTSFVTSSPREPTSGLVTSSVSLPAGVATGACANTDCPKQGIYLCGQCRMKAYCSSECQQKNWADHKTVCENMGAATSLGMQTNGEDDQSGEDDQPTTGVVTSPVVEGVAQPTSSALAPPQPASSSFLFSSAPPQPTSSWLV